MSVLILLVNIVESRETKNYFSADEMTTSIYYYVSLK